MRLFRLRSRKYQPRRKAARSRPLPSAPVSLDVERARNKLTRPLHVAGTSLTLCALPQIEQVSVGPLLGDGLERCRRSTVPLRAICAKVVAFARIAASCQRSVGIAHWRPAEVPAGGHENCPFAARSSAHRVVVVLAA